MRMRLATLGCVLALMGAAASAGGWAVVTVKHVPDYVTAGEIVTLTYAVRVHGRALVDDLRGTIEATAGTRRVSASAVAASEKGYYRAAFTLPGSGDWTIAIDSGYGARSIVRVGIRAVAAGERVTVQETERGRRLFAAKGCASCHSHRSVPSSHPAAIGPQLTGNRYDPVWLRRQLADPPRSRPADGKWTMPDLDLSAGEIDALTAFLNEPERFERAER